MMKTTQFTRKEDVSGNWYVLDAKDVAVGRLASMAAYLLQGKHRPEYTPHVCHGDHVVIINAEKVKLTGSKWDQKKYYRHSGYPGGLKETTAKHLREEHPERILIHAVKGMLPRNRLGRRMLTNFRVYAGAEHPHVAQQPTPIEMSEKHFIKVKKES